MRFGPVFRFEMNVRSRRMGTFVIRGAYGFFLLLAFVIPLARMRGLSNAGELPPRELPRVAETFLSLIIALQSLTVMILTPALVAGALAQERQRGNLQLLMASPLSSLEIILGKLLARVYDLLMILAVAVPVLCILTMMGGIDVRVIALSDGVLLTTGFFIAAASIAISSLCGDPRRAILATYSIVAGWTALPFLIEMARGVGTGPVLRIADWSWPLEYAARYSMPLSILSRQGGKPDAWAYEVLATMAVQMTMAVLLILAGAAILRPSLKRAGPFGWRSPFAPLFTRRSLLRRPSCGDLPMVWKECNLARSTILFRMAATVVGLAIAVPMADVTWTYAIAAFEELRAHGYGSLVSTSARNAFNVFLRTTLVCLYLLSALALAVRSATSITSESERSTWTSLVATPLDADEILAGKLLGAFSGIRWLGLVYAAYLTLGLVLGAIHPVAGMFSVILLVSLLASVAELGLLFSMMSRSSTRALAATMLTLLALNTLPMFCDSGGSGLPISLATMSPLLIGLSLASYEDIDRMADRMGEWNFSILTLLAIGLLMHCAADFLLWKSCVNLFDAAADRPRRDPARSRITPGNVQPVSPEDIIYLSIDEDRGTPISEASAEDARET